MKPTAFLLLLTLLAVAQMSYFSHHPKPKYDTEIVSGINGTLRIRSIGQ
jgi:hypothetical protein